MFYFDGLLSYVLQSFYKRLSDYNHQGGSCWHTNGLTIAQQQWLPHGSHSQRWLNPICQNAGTQICRRRRVAAPRNGMWHR